jgi:hypothetical protein
VSKNFDRPIHPLWTFLASLEILHIITLLPKIKEANTIKQYRPICLLNVVYKIFIKALMLRLDKVMGRIINRSQSGFLKDRNIIDGVLALHEILHDTRIKKKDGLILKLDFEKHTTSLVGTFCMNVLNRGVLGLNGVIGLSL